MATPLVWRFERHVNSAIQRRDADGSAPDDALAGRDAQAVAQDGVSSGAGTRVPHQDRIQSSFGARDISTVFGDEAEVLFRAGTEFTVFDKTVVGDEVVIKMGEI